MAKRKYTADQIVTVLRQVEVAPATPSRQRTQDYPAHGAEPHASGRLRAPRAHCASSGLCHSQRIRKRIEEAFGWMKTIGGLRKTRYLGPRVRMHAHIVAAAYNLIRIEHLAPAPA